MKSIVTAVAAAISICGFSITASQEWVKDYISRLNGSTNSVISVNSGENVYTVTYQLRTEHALMVTNSSGTYANGTKFAYAGGGVFTNKVLGASILATSTNFVWNGIQSHVESGFDRFGGNFSVCGGMITVDESEGLK